MGADNTFKLKIVASNRVFYDGRAQTLVIPALAASWAYWPSMRTASPRWKWAKCA